MPGFTFIPVKLNRKPFPYGYENKPHINLYELEKQPGYRGGRFVHDDRAVSNIIYGDAAKLPPVDPKFRGHYHPECAEFWLILKGQIPLSDRVSRDGDCRRRRHCLCAAVHISRSAFLGRRGFLPAGDERISEYFAPHRRGATPLKSVRNRRRGGSAAFPCSFTFGPPSGTLSVLFSCEQST